MCSIMCEEGGSCTTCQDTDACISLIASSDVFQPTGLIVFALQISISLLASVAAEQGLMQGSEAPTVSAIWSYSGLCNY